MKKSTFPFYKKSSSLPRLILKDSRHSRSLAKSTPRKILTALLIIVMTQNSLNLPLSVKEMPMKLKKIKKHIPSINSNLLDKRMLQKSKILRKDSNNLSYFKNIWILDSLIIIKKSIQCFLRSHPNFLTFLKLLLLLDKQR